MTAHDWPQVAEIWAEGIATGNATFEPSPPSWPDFDAGRAPHLRLVAEEPDASGTLLGWAAAGPVSSRRAYAGVAELSVYVRASAQGRGIGRTLLTALIQLAEVTGTWTLCSGIFPENVSSLKLHEACGFQRLGTRVRVGRLDGRWRDVVLLERRSPDIADAEPLVRVTLPPRDGAAEDDDLAAVHRLLSKARLPVAGVEDAWRRWVADADGAGGQVVGSAALERYGDAFLLRSVAVEPGRRGDGLGGRLVRAALRCADLEVGGTAEVCLVTETADGWFDRFGFRPAARDELPAAVEASPQLSGGLCPASASAYLRAR